MEKEKIIEEMRLAISEKQSRGFLEMPPETKGCSNEELAEHLIVNKGYRKESEVESLEKENERIMKEKTALECIVATARNQAKQEVTRDIIALIDDITGVEYDNHNALEVGIIIGAKKVRNKIVKKYNVIEQSITEDKRNT